MSQLPPHGESNDGQPQNSMPPVAVPASIWISAGLAFLCCQPAGILALVFAAIAVSSGTTEPPKALKFLGYAKTSAAWGIGLGAAWILIIVTIQIIAILASA